MLWRMPAKQAPDRIYAPYVPNPATAKVQVAALAGIVVLAVVLGLLALSSNKSNKPSTPGATTMTVSGSFSGGTAQCPAPTSTSNTATRCVIAVTLPAGKVTLSAATTWNNADELGVGLTTKTGTKAATAVQGRGSVTLSATKLTPGGYLLAVTNVSKASAAIEWSVVITFG